MESDAEYWMRRALTAEKERDSLKLGPYVGIEYFQAEMARAQRAEAEAERLRVIEELYNAGVAHWNPVYQVILKEKEALRRALLSIRDATHTNAVTLRGMADMALGAKVEQEPERCPQCDSLAVTTELRMQIDCRDCRERFYRELP